MLIVLRLGGSVIGSPTNIKLIGEYASFLRKLGEQGHKIVVVVGGGALAREFIELGSQLGLSEEAQDWLAIQVSRLYALLLSSKLGEKSMKDVPTSVDEAVEALESGEVCVMGGLKPGMTTDAVAAYVGHKTNAQLMVKATDQDGIYNKDPKRHKDARKIKKITFNDLNQLFRESRYKAGIHQILDPVAIKILKEIELRTIVVEGHSTDNIRRAIEGEEIGTIITG